MSQLKTNFKGLLTLLILLNIFINNLHAAQQSSSVNFNGTNITLVDGDITKQKFNNPASAAIVNAANVTLLGGGGISGVIHRAAGPGLNEECAKLKADDQGVRCPIGHARITGSHNLKEHFAHIVHTVGPSLADYPGSAFRNGTVPSAEHKILLENAYENSLKVAHKAGVNEIAFPSISTGIFAYPIEQASKIALTQIFKYVKHNPGAFKEIRFVLFHDRNKDEDELQDITIYKNVLKQVIHEMEIQ
ncbi:MAG: macro domain-containing protein [Candidatus Babeliales bacterium]|nr:macro domain-containing protein [Candidatus Babeliales bacterium]